MSGAELTEIIKAVGLPGTVFAIIMIYVLRNGGIKFIFRDEIKDDLGDIKHEIAKLSDEMHTMKTDIEVMKALYNKKN